MKNKEKDNKDIDKINKNKKIKREKYNFIQAFNNVLINVFRLILLFMLIEAIRLGDKERVQLVVLVSLSSFYREFVWLITKVRISSGMQIITTTFVILASLFGTLMGVYDKVIWWDTMLHFLSGIILSFFGLMILAVMKKRNANLRYSLFLLISFSFFFAMTAGILWELMEFTADNTLGLDAQRSKGVDYGVLDTMLDIVANTVGAFSACLGMFLFLRRKTEEQSYILLDDWFIVPDDNEIQYKRFLKRHKRRIKRELEKMQKKENKNKKIKK